MATATCTAPWSAGKCSRSILSSRYPLLHPEVQRFELARLAMLVRPGTPGHWRRSKRPSPRTDSGAGNCRNVRSGPREAMKSTAATRDNGPSILAAITVLSITNSAATMSVTHYFLDGPGTTGSCCPVFSIADLTSVRNKQLLASLNRGPTIWLGPNLTSITLIVTKERGSYARLFLY